MKAILIITFTALIATGVRIYTNDGSTSIVCGLTEDNEIAVILAHSEAYVITPAETRANTCVERSNYTDSEICNCFHNEGLECPEN